MKTPQEWFAEFKHGNPDPHPWVSVTQGDIKAIQDDALAIHGYRFCDRCGYGNAADIICPNDGEVMRPQTWQERCLHLSRRARAAEDACALKTELLRAVRHSMDSDKPFPRLDKITEAIDK